jgi:hypothetical protein
MSYEFINIVFDPYSSITLGKDSASEPIDESDDPDNEDIISQFISSDDEERRVVNNHTMEDAFNTFMRMLNSHDISLEDFLKSMCLPLDDKRINHKTNCTCICTCSRASSSSASLKQNRWASMMLT